MESSQNPDIKWYLSISRDRGVTPRCPFASAERCPRYYQSVSSFGHAKTTVALTPDEDKRLRDYWEKSELWPQSEEDVPYFFGNDRKFWSFSNVCPELAYERFGFFVGKLVDYYDAEERYEAHKSLKGENCPNESWQWKWASLTPLHFTECPLYSPLIHASTAGKQQPKDSIETAVMPTLKESEYITLVEGLAILQQNGLSAEEAKSRLRQAFVQKALFTSPLFAFEYDEAEIDWTTGYVKIPLKKDRFCPTCSRSDFDRYFFEEQKVQPPKSGRDWKLIRELMLRLQDILRPGVTTVFNGDDKEVALEGYTSEQINLHLSLLAQMGYVDLARSQPTIGVALKGLTPAGYDFLERNRDGLEETPHPSVKAQLSRKVFIVHGHDEAAREAVARFLEKLGFDVIILHEQINKGRTIIEKFEANGDVGFVVVLLTPDDEGGKIGGVTGKRARQNVLLEWGYFIGRLGRSRVCALKKGDIELPSDIVGIVWEPFDEHGAWKHKLAKELDGVGFDIEWSRVGRS